MSEIDLSPPKDSSEEFLVYWNMFIDEVTDRPLFRKSHLYQLRILCDLCVEYEYLKTLIETEGRFYMSFGRNGEQQKTTESVRQMKDVVTQISVYSKMLNLTLGKDVGKVTKEKNEFLD